MYFTSHLKSSYNELTVDIAVSGSNNVTKMTAIIKILFTNKCTPLYKEVHLLVKGILVLSKCTVQQ